MGKRRRGEGLVSGRPVAKILHARLGRRPFLVFDGHRIFENSAVVVAHSTRVLRTSTV